MRVQFLILLLVYAVGVQAQTYILYPAQRADLAQVWTSDDTRIVPIQSSSFVVDNAIAFVAIDSDGNGAFDRAGIPNGDIITLYPAGVLFGFTKEARTIHVSCNYPAQTPVTIQGAFTLALPAGDCLLSRIDNNEERREVITITANDYTEITFTNERPVRNLVIMLLIIAIGASLVAAYILRGRRRHHKQASATPPSDVLRVLKAEERIIIEYLCSRGPQLAGVVRKDLAIPKTTFHRTLVRLREKELVVEEEYGNTTQLRWNDSFHRK